MKTSVIEEQGLRRTQIKPRVQSHTIRHTSRQKWTLRWSLVYIAHCLDCHNKLYRIHDNNMNIVDDNNALHVLYCPSAWVIRVYSLAPPWQPGILLGALFHWVAADAVILNIFYASTLIFLLCPHLHLYLNLAHVLFPNPCPHHALCLFLCLHHSPLLRQTCSTLTTPIYI